MARIRYTGLSQAQELRGDMEMLTLGGSLSPDGAHLHVSVSDAQRNVTGGHAEYGGIIRTTAEILMMLLPGHLQARTGNVDRIQGISNSARRTPARMSFFLVLGG